VTRYMNVQRIPEGASFAPEEEAHQIDLVREAIGKNGAVTRTVVETRPIPPELGFEFSRLWLPI